MKNYDFHIETKITVKAECEDDAAKGACRLFQNRFQTFQDWHQWKDLLRAPLDIIIEETVTID